MATNQAETQVNPGVPGFQTVFTAIGGWSNLLYLVQMGTIPGHKSFPFFLIKYDLLLLSRMPFPLELKLLLDHMSFFKCLNPGLPDERPLPMPLSLPGDEPVQLL